MQINIINIYKIFKKRKYNYNNENYYDNKNQFEIQSFLNSFSFSFINIFYIIDIIELFKQYFNHYFIDIIIMIMIFDVQLDFKESHLR